MISLINSTNQKWQREQRVAHLVGNSGCDLYATLPTFVDLCGQPCIQAPLGWGTKSWKEKRKRKRKRQQSQQSYSFCKHPRTGRSSSVPSAPKQKVYRVLDTADNPILHSNYYVMYFSVHKVQFSVTFNPEMQPNFTTIPQQINVCIPCFLIWNWYRILYEVEKVRCKSRNWLSYNYKGCIGLRTCKKIPYKTQSVHVHSKQREKLSSYIYLGFKQQDEHVKGEPALHKPTSHSHSCFIHTNDQNTKRCKAMWRS